MIAQASPAAGPLRSDPAKRVNYTLGLVLGVDEFQQDQLYHAAARRGHDRLLHGYGTVWGLRVNPVPGVDPEIQVDPGVAVDPCGREICVPDLMCVKLARWLDRHRSVLEPLTEPSPPGNRRIPLAVILCHRECETDTVPVPGEPCRSQEDAMQPSRIRETFELKLALRDDAPWGSPPPDVTGLTVFRQSQPEEQAVRAFGRLLARVQTTTDPELSGEGAAELLAGVRAIESAIQESTLASPPADTDDPILLPAATAPEILRDAFRVWVTEVRPKVRSLESRDPCADPDAECCVLLSEIDLEVTPEWAVASGTIESNEGQRPYLLHTRLLQEWLIAGGGEAGRSDVDTWATLEILGPSRIRVWVHHDQWLDLPKEAITVVINDTLLPGEYVVEVPYAGIRNVWDVVISQEMSDGDVVEIRFDTQRLPLIAAPGGMLEYYDARALEVDLSDETLVRDVQIDRRLPLEREETTLENPANLRDVDPREVNPLEGNPLEMKSIETRPLELSMIDARLRDIRPMWAPSTAERTGRTIADELRGPSGEYLDRYGWSLSAFTIYDRLQGGDLEGEYQLPIVAKIQRFPVDPATPQADQYLVSDGATWLPRFLPNGTRDLAGRYPGNTVVGLRGRRVHDAEPLEDQFLMWDGDQWLAADLPEGERDLAGRYPESTVVGIQGTPVSNAPPGREQYLKYDVVEEKWAPADLPDAKGDLLGKYPALTIAKLQGKPVVARNPVANQVLAFVKGRWIPSDVDGLVGNAAGDVTGPYTSLNVGKLRGRQISTAVPTAGQVLTFVGTQWVPTTIAFGPASDLGGLYPDNQVSRLQGKPISAAAPSNGQVLQYQESTPGTGVWVPGTVAGGTTGPAAGDLAGTYPGPRVVKLQTVPVSEVKPVQNQYLMFDGKSWIPAGIPTGPALATDYQVIAAGTYRVGDSEAIPTSAPFNGLDLLPTGNFSYTLTGFPYEPEAFVYVVKAISSLGVVVLSRPKDTRVATLGIRVIPMEDSEVPELHVEISRYPVR